MNGRLAAQALRLLADALEAPAEDDDTAAPRARRKPRLVRPEGENDELATKRAKKILERHGFVPTVKS